MREHTIYPLQAFRQTGLDKNKMQMFNGKYRHIPGYRMKHWTIIVCIYFDTFSMLIPLDTEFKKSWFFTERFRVHSQPHGGRRASI